MIVSGTTNPTTMRNMMYDRLLAVGSSQSTEQLLDWKHAMHVEVYMYTCNMSSQIVNSLRNYLMPGPSRSYRPQPTSGGKVATKAADQAANMDTKGDLSSQ